MWYKRNWSTDQFPTTNLFKHKFSTSITRIQTTEKHNIPVSVTWKKNVTVITNTHKHTSQHRTIWTCFSRSHWPSVKVRAIRNRENGGSCRRAFKLAKHIASITNGATILNTYPNIDKSSKDSTSTEQIVRTSNAAIENGLNIGIKRYTGSK
jgi:hypothetical protein